MTEVPEPQTIQLNADGPLDSEMPHLLRLAIQRARRGGVTRLLDGEMAVAEIVPALMTIHVESDIAEEKRQQVLEELDAIYGISPARRSLHGELVSLLNSHSAENASNTPDFVLAAFLMDCLDAFNRATSHRDHWYGVHLAPGDSHWMDPSHYNPIAPPPEGKST